MNAIKDIRKELRKIMAAQQECLHPAGFIRSSCRYKYQILVEKAKSLRDSIDWLENMNMEMK